MTFGETGEQKTYIFVCTTKGKSDEDFTTLCPHQFPVLLFFSYFVLLFHHCFSLLLLFE